ncbi:MAG: 1-acyl-sn-glycerol-3-phosphate acyltransferase [Bacteroidales bacterium]|nr:1-acyl-sn-glycerol-3-phosphate acyltransferase [Bacteroidales bacterium]
MAKIWERNRWYAILRHYVDYCIKESFGRVKVSGTIPEDGAVVVAPNHTNTLMDALVVLQSRKDRTVFGARADIFRKSAANKALRFLKILPLARQRDGMETLMASYGTFDEVEDSLDHNVPFCMFPEGHHTPGRELQPLRKGIARIALRSARKRKTYIVPTGINYAHFYRYRSAVELVYGPALEIDPEMDEKQLLQDLHTKMSQLVFHEAPQWHYRWWLLPFWPVAAALSLPMWLTAELLCRQIKDKAFCNSVRFLVKLLLEPVLLIIYAVVFFLTLPWWLAAALLVYFLFSYGIFYDIVNVKP